MDSANKELKFILSQVSAPTSYQKLDLPPHRDTIHRITLLRNVNKKSSEQHVWNPWEGEFNGSWLCMKEMQKFFPAGARDLKKRRLPRGLGENRVTSSVNCGIMRVERFWDTVHLFDMNEIEIYSNWTCDDENKLKNLITFVEAEYNICDIENVTPERCICLEDDESGGLDSKPELILKLKHSIKEIIIFSEGSLIEVFGVHDEYLFTSIPEFVDDWEGLAVYQAKIVLPGISTCKLRFTRIKEKGRLWLYSVQLSVIKTDVNETSNSSLFNFENVNKLISSSSQEISEKADKFRKFFESYSKNQNSQPFSIQTLFNVINKECNLQLSDCKRTVVECLNSASLLGSNENLTIRKEDSQLNRNELSLECQYLKGYIDRKFIEMREDIMKHVEIKLSEIRLENKAELDNVIKLLNSSKI